jgi:steroid delta-isomerase
VLYADANALKMADRVALEKIHAYYRMVDAGDFDGLLNLFTNDAVYCRPGYPTLRGHAHLSRFYRELRVIKQGRHTISRAVVRYPQVAVQGEFDGVLSSDQQVSLRFADFFVIEEDGRFSRRDTFFFVPLV